MSQRGVILTGAGGNLGAVLRRHFYRQGRPLVISDQRTLTPTSNETFLLGDLVDRDFAGELLTRGDQVIHLAGMPSNRPLEELIGPNFLAVGNLYRQARRLGAKRILFASSNHVTGMTRPSEPVDPSHSWQPDSHYAASKAWGEAVARMYWDKYGIESLCMRIGSCLEHPHTVRHLSTWLSHADFCRLVDAGLGEEHLGFQVVYGVSANQRSWWRHASAECYWSALDEAESHVHAIGPDHLQPDADALWQGGSYAALCDGE